MLKSAKVLFDGLKTVKEELKDKYEMLTDCIELHNLMAQDCENEEFDLTLAQADEINTMIKSTVDYMENYVDELHKVNEMSKGIISLNPVVNILKTKTYNLEVEFAEILNELKDIQEKVSSMFELYIAKDYAAKNAEFEELGDLLHELLNSFNEKEAH